MATFVWMCFPRWHDKALFSALIGGGGSYAITPMEPHVWGGYYEPGSLIWRSRWVTNTAVIECREALAMPSRADRAVVLRRIVACQGTARIHCRLRTLADFGTGAVRAIHREGDTWIVEHDHVQLRWMGAGTARGLSQHEFAGDGDHRAGRRPPRPCHGGGTEGQRRGYPHGRSRLEGH